MTYYEQYLDTTLNMKIRKYKMLETESVKHIDVTTTTTTIISSSKPKPIYL